MKESAQIAVSLVKAMFPDKAELFEKNDLHIHVPEGAVPKDGPSAGITLTTALASLVTGHAVSPEYGMTGEVSLRGVVTPIGGLPEKLMAPVRKMIRIGAIFKLTAYSPRRSLAAVHFREILFFTLSFFASHQVVIFDGAVGLLNKGVQFAESPADVQAI
jgi:hypothetical protein